MNKENYFYENYDLTKNGQGYASRPREIWPFTAVSSRFDNEITDEQATAQLHKQARAGFVQPFLRHLDYFGKTKDEAELLNLTTEELQMEWQMAIQKNNQTILSHTGLKVTEEIRTNNIQDVLEYDLAQIGEESPGHLYLIKSPQDTRKTQSLKALMTRLPNDAEVLLLGHRTELLRQTCEELDITWYNDDKLILNPYTNEKHPGDTIKNNRYHEPRLGITWHSLEDLRSLKVNLGGYEIKTPNVIILDEIDQIFKDLFTASESLQRKTKAYDVEFILGHMFQEADLIICLDADISEITTATISELLNRKDYTYNFAVNTFPSLRSKQLTLIDNEEQVQPHLLHLLNRGYKLFIACETKEHYLNLSAEHIANMIDWNNQKAGSDGNYKYIKYKIITGDERTKEANKHYIQNPNKYLAEDLENGEIQCLICTNVLETGWSFGHPDLAPEAQFDYCYGIFPTKGNRRLTRGLNCNSILQFIRRPRNVKQTFAYIGEVMYPETELSKLVNEADQHIQKGKIESEREQAKPNGLNRPIDNVIRYTQTEDRVRRIQPRTMLKRLWQGYGGDVTYLKDLMRSHKFKAIRKTKENIKKMLQTPNKTRGQDRKILAERTTAYQFLTKCAELRTILDLYENNKDTLPNEQKGIKLTEEDCKRYLETDLPRAFELTRLAFLPQEYAENIDKKARNLAEFFNKRDLKILLDTIYGELNVSQDDLLKPNLERYVTLENINLETADNIYRISEYLNRDDEDLLPKENFDLRYLSHTLKKLDFIATCYSEYDKRLKPEIKSVYKIKEPSAKNMANHLIDEDKKRTKKYRRYEINGISIFKGERTLTKKHSLLLEHFRRMPYETLNNKEKLYLRFKTHHLHFTRYKHPHPGIQQLKSELLTTSPIKILENSADDELLPIHYDLYQDEVTKGERKQ